jgi:imidazolonepropionase-like amidohydrolase
MTSSQPTPQGHLLRAPLVLTSLDTDPIRDGAIRVRGAEIVAVDTAARLGVEDDEQVWDFPTGTLLPGLIEAHEHLSGHDKYAIGDPDSQEPDMMYALVATFHCRRLIDEGITTARIPGAPGHIDLMVRRAIREGYVEGPRLICAGRNLSMTGGHGSEGGVEVDGPYEAAKAAREQLKAGADFLKIMASGGVGITREGEEPSQPELTVEELRAAADVMHSAGRRITAHADGVPGISNALEAGIDCIEHGIYLTADHARFMAQHDVPLVPTLSTMEGIYHHGLEYGMPASWIPIAEAILEPHRESFRHALDAGVLFAAGTDGFGELVQEIEIFATFGVSPYRAIQAATRDAATIIGPHERYGSLQPGFSADIIAVEGDPLESLDRLRHVEFVMLEGIVKRGSPD